MADFHVFCTSCGARFWLLPKHVTASGEKVYPETLDCGQCGAGFEVNDSNVVEFRPAKQRRQEAEAAEARESERVLREALG